MECSWSYQHPARVGKEKQEKVAAAPRAVREIAWKAQCRLSARYRALVRKGKPKNVAVTAVARELRGLHLGHQSRGGHGPCGGQVRRVFRGSKEQRSTPIAGSLRRGSGPAKTISCNGGGGATAGEFPTAL